MAILTLELGKPYPLGMGFYLEGFGGMLALHRTFDETAMRAALPTGQLRNVLFPSDPVHHTAEILHAPADALPRPARKPPGRPAGQDRLGLADAGQVRARRALRMGWPEPADHPRAGQRDPAAPDLAIIRLNMDAVGILDFDAGTFALDAVLYDSKICGRFVITGAMAMRMGWKDAGPGFALAVGGLHPRFTAPPGFPSVARLQLALTNGDNPKLICQAYFAITSNTVQFGADCSLYAAAYGFSIDGDVGFDVLIQLLPFHFLAEFRASVQLKRGSHNLFKVSVAGALEGPLPLRVVGQGHLRDPLVRLLGLVQRHPRRRGYAERPRARSTCSRVLIDALSAAAIVAGAAPCRSQHHGQPAPAGDRGRAAAPARHA